MKATPINHGTVGTPAPAAPPGLLVHVATRATTIRGYRRASRPNSTRRAGAISNQGWSREFDEPVPLRGGRTLRTLHDAATYITGLPKKESALPEWQAAIEALILVANHGGPTMFARIGMMKALNRHVQRVFDPSRKEKHWGKRKLARDR
ncbi:hypothetical protein [Bradyrhizobium erythrophlei]|uniref:hypothetical protein n=1 Tax=Bradyrhizobium erythrophlei TaxID=1437360 RepID=UPI001FD88957|nr:hypothetical protein [Bradyrhizobium erythrophlei]